MPSRGFTPCPGLAGGDSVPPSPGDSAGGSGTPPCHPLGVSLTPAGAAGLVLNAEPRVPSPAPHASQVPFFLSFFFFLFSPLSYSPVDQLFNTFHPSSELPEVSCFKLNTFLFEST